MFSPKARYFIPLLIFLMPITILMIAALLLREPPQANECNLDKITNSYSELIDNATSWNELQAAQDGLATLIAKCSNEQANVEITPVAALDSETATVTRVIDGDTIDVLFSDGRSDRVRYIGMNTPETYEACGSEATATNEMLVSGQMVSLVKDISERDRYGRLLRYIYIGNTFINAELVRLGYAQAADYPPDTAYSALFHELENQARVAGIGCYATSDLSGISAPVMTTATLSQNSPELFATTIVTSAITCECNQGNLYNCPAFSSEAEAQSCFNSCIVAGMGDVHGLDGDGDGRACEALP